MGDPRPDNHDGSQPDDGTGGLPDFPPEWGEIIIPDDASELDAEAQALRRELRRKALGRPFVLRLFGQRGTSRADGEPSLGVPIVIMAVAVLTTLVSLFVVTWGRQSVQPEPTASGPAGPAGPGATSGAASTGTLARLADLTLTDAAGGSVRLGGLLPAIILLADTCDCVTLIRDLATAVPAGVHVLIVGLTARPTRGAPANVVALGDPVSALTSNFPAGKAGRATAVLVSGAGDVVATFPDADGIEDIHRLDPG